MIDTEALYVEIPLDRDRFVDLLDDASWRELAGGAAQAYTSETLYEGEYSGARSARIMRLTTGDPDAEVRIAIDMAPMVLSRPVLALSRSLMRAFGARTGDRARMLARVALLIHMVEPGDGVAGFQPLPLKRGLEGALGLAHSPVRPEIWSPLERSIFEFAPTVTLDVRDGGGAADRLGLAMILHDESIASAGRDGAPGSEPPDAARAAALVADLRSRGFRPHIADARERCRAGLTVVAERVLRHAGTASPPLSTAAAAASMRGALGLTAISLGLVEATRAEVLAATTSAMIAQSLSGFRGMAE